MKSINLRELYPYYTTDFHIEVPDGIADQFHQFDLYDSAYYLRTYRHGGLLSLDCGDQLERSAAVVVLSPYDIVERKEKIHHLYRAIAQLPEKQRSRICAYYLLDMTLQEIADSEGTCVSSVQEGIQRGLRRLRKILKDYDDHPEKSHKK